MVVSLYGAFGLQLPWPASPSTIPVRLKWQDTPLLMAFTVTWFAYHVVHHLLFQTFHRAHLG